MRRALRLLAVLTALTLVAAACDDDGDDDTTAADQPTTTDATGEVALTVVEDDEFGAVLRDGAGMSLYAFTDDTENTSNCTGECLAAWPPLTVEGTDVAVGDGVDQSLVGTITREDSGDTQATVGGMPLYYFASDTAPGDTMGQGVGGKWFQVMPDGSLVGA